MYVVVSYNLECENCVSVCTCVCTSPEETSSNTFRKMSPKVAFGLVAQVGLA